MSDHVIEIEDTVTARYIGTTFQVIFILDTRSVFSFTANSTTDFLTSASHDYILNSQVQVNVSGGGTLPAPLVAGTTYFVRDVSGNDYRLSATRGGSAIDITSVGTGVFTITDLALDNKVRDVANYVRKEIADYDGIVNRPSVTFSGSVITSDTQVTLEQDITANNTTGTIAPLVDALLLIKGGTTARGNTTGILVNYQRLLAPRTLEAGQSYSLRYPIINPIPVA